MDVYFKIIRLTLVVNSQRGAVLQVAYPEITKYMTKKRGSASLS